MSFWKRLFGDPKTGVVRELGIDREEGFVDLTLGIAHRERGRKGSHKFHALARVGPALMGLEIEIDPEWSRWVLEEEGITLWQGRVTYRALGRESDQLLSLLASEYGIASPGTEMARRIDFAAVALNGHPREVLESGSEIKLFFESETEGEYAELYTNVYPSAGRVELKEKDPNYRAALLRAMVVGNPAT